jgi:hypothetical protein
MQQLLADGNSSRPAVLTGVSYAKCSQQLRREGSRVLRLQVEDQDTA